MRFFASALFLVALHASHACLWDSDTLRDELKLREAHVFDLLAAQFPHHGQAYYEARVDHLTAADSLTRSQQNDLAVALIRLQRFDEAHSILDSLHESDPGDYFTLSNLGVLEKKRKRYSEAADYISSALAMKPDGHMGLGDWYLQSIRFSEKVAASPGQIPERNFLGMSYAGSFLPDLSGRQISTLTPHYDRLIKLLQNDQNFADGFLVMGDELARRGNLDMAFLAFARAMELKHPNPDEVRRRMRTLLNHWEAKMPAEARGAWRKAKVAKARSHLARGRDWLTAFQKGESELVNSGKGDAVNFADVTAHMAKKGIIKFRP